MKSKKAVYRADLPGKMYSFFVTYHETDSIPTFLKFAVAERMTAADIERFRSHATFDRAYSECCRIQRDLLTDRALTRKFDPSFVKFLLTEDAEGKDGDDSLSVTVDVLP